MRKLLPTLISVHGLFFDDMMEIPEIMESFQEDHPKRELCESIMAFVNDAPWSSQDLENFVKAASP